MLRARSRKGHRRCGAILFVICGRQGRCDPDGVLVQCSITSVRHESELGRLKSSGRVAPTSGQELVSSRVDLYEREVHIARATARIVAAQRNGCHYPRTAASPHQPMLHSQWNSAFRTPFQIGDHPATLKIWSTLSGVDQRTKVIDKRGISLSAIHQNGRLNPPGATQRACERSSNHSRPRARRGQPG